MKNLDLLKEIEEEERTTVRQKKATDCGYTGLSVLHRLYPLYGFLYDEHIVFDEMHTVSLNIVKHALQDLMEDEENTIDWAIVDQRLNAIPWPKGMTINLLIEHWVAEYRKQIKIHFVAYSMCDAYITNIRMFHHSHTQN